MSKEKVLITGGAGYLGSVLTKYLLGEGHQVTCLDNLRFHQQTPLLFADDPNYEFVYGDARDERVLGSLMSQHDTFIPLAAIVGVPACKSHSDDATTTNTNAIKALNDLRSTQQKLIYPNTNSGYGTQSGERFCTEETPLEPISHYGKTKVESEKILFSSGKNCVVLRLATVFGISPRMRLDLLVNDFVYKAMTDRYIVMYEPHFNRNFVHIKDVARAFEHSMIHFEDMRNGAFNVGLDDANLSKQELAQKIKKYFPNFEIIPREIGEDPDKRNYIVSSAKIREAGFTPRYTLDDGIRELRKGYSVLLKNNPYKND